MNRCYGLAVVGLVMVVGSAASAQSLQSVTGTVLVDSGQGFRAVPSTVVLTPGMRVMVNPNGSAVVAYENGCSQQVMPGSVVTVSSGSQCMAQQATGSGRTATQIPTQANQPPGTPPPPEFLGLPGGPLPYVIGAGVIAGGAALAIGLSNKDKPASGQ